MLRGTKRRLREIFQVHFVLQYKTSNSLNDQIQLLQKGNTNSNQNAFRPCSNSIIVCIENVIDNVTLLSIQKEGRDPV